MSDEPPADADTGIEGSGGRRERGSWARGLLGFAVAAVGAHLLLLTPVGQLPLGLYWFAAGGPASLLLGAVGWVPPSVVLGLVIAIPLVVAAVLLRRVWWVCWPLWGITAGYALWLVVRNLP